MALIQWDPHLILPRESSVCLGTFDGVHLGHQALLEKCVHRAVEKSLRPVAFTFSNIPFGSSKAPLLPPLTTLEEKEQRMSSAGIKDVVFTVFNEEFASIAINWDKRRIEPVRGEGLPDNLNIVFLGGEK